MTDDQSKAELALAVLQTRFDDLLQGLRNASATSGATPVSSPLVALTQVMEFLLSFEAMRPFTAPLESLRASLDDVRRGIRAPMFEPLTVAGHRGPDTNRERLVRAASMVAVEILQKGGMPVGDAITTVCLKLEQAGVRMGRTKPRVISTAALRKWREQATANGDDTFSASATAAVVDDLVKEGQWPPTLGRANEIADGLVSSIANPKS